MLLGSQVAANRIDHESAKRITHESNLRIPASILRSGDLVSVRVGDPGTTAVVPEELDGCNCASMMIVRRHQSFNSEWLCCMMNSTLGRSQVANAQYGTAQKQFNIGDAVGFLFPVPPKVEQDALASVFADTDALIDSLEQLLTKKRQIKQGAMQELLTGKRRLPGFRDSWARTPFSEVLVRLNAKRHQIQASEYQAVGDLPVIDQGQRLVVGYSNQVEKRFSCPRGGVIVFGDHTCITKYVDFDFVVGADGTQLLAAHPGHSARFIAYQLEYSGVEATGYNRHFKFLLEREFNVPVFEEQQAIATVLSDLDAHTAALQTRLTKARDLKQAMAQALLTGRIRLPVENPA